jgi:hypothetical protein
MKLQALMFLRVCMCVCVWVNNVQEAEYRENM